MRHRAGGVVDGKRAVLVVRPRTLAVHEVVGIEAECRTAERAGVDQSSCGRPLGVRRGGGGDGAVGAIGRDEIDQRFDVLQFGCRNPPSFYKA